MENMKKKLPQPTVLAPGVVHLALGNGNEAWLFPDGNYTARPWEDCAWNASKVDVERSLADAGLPTDQAPLQVLPLLVRWNGELILVDGGCGTAYGPNFGWARQRFADLGFAPEQINRVLFTHLHLDHVAGALSDDLKTLRYPNAQYACAKAEWDFWNQPAPDLSQTKVPDDRKTEILKAVRPALETLKPHLKFFVAGDEVVPGVKTIDLIGHTPGQVGFVFNGAGVPTGPEQENGTSFELVCVADAIVEPALHVPHPEWIVIGDVLPTFVEATRRRVLNTAVEREQLIFGYHFALPGFGVIRKTVDGAFQFRASRWDFEAP